MSTSFIKIVKKCRKLLLLVIVGPLGVCNRIETKTVTVVNNLCSNLKGTAAQENCRGKDKFTLRVQKKPLANRRVVLEDFVISNITDNNEKDIEFNPSTEILEYTYTKGGRFGHRKAVPSDLTDDTFTVPDDEIRVTE